jgi:uncharacterized membrane protein
MTGFNQTKPRPVLKIPPTPADILVMLIGAVGVLVCFFVVLRYWPLLPDTVPTHFGPSGKPDAWGGKASLLILPIVGAVLYSGMALLSRFPHIYNYPWTITEQNARTQYRLAAGLMRWLGLGIAWLFAYLQWNTIQTAFNKSNGLGSGFMILVLAVTFVPLVVYFIKGRQAR